MASDTSDVAFAMATPSSTAAQLDGASLS